MRDNQREDMESGFTSSNNPFISAFFMNNSFIDKEVPFL